MNQNEIVILDGTTQKLDPAPNVIVINRQDLRAWVLSGAVMRHLFRYRQVSLMAYRLGVIKRPFITGFLIRLLSRGKSAFVDDENQHQTISIKFLIFRGFQLLRDMLRKGRILRRIQDEVLDLLSEYSDQKPGKPRNALDLSESPVYLRTNLEFGVRSGGSIGHIAGVLNNFHHFSGHPIFLTTDTIPTVRQDLTTYLVNPEDAFMDFMELPELFFNKTFDQEAIKRLRHRKLAFIYHRYSLNNYSGVKLARRYSLPLVIEYNGSETWIARNWLSPLRYNRLSSQIEHLNLQAADLVVVVSKPLQEDLLDRGIEAVKILINPNGVNTDLYSPEIDGSRVRRRYALNGKTVIGFIGTFGVWHGAEVLALAFAQLLQEYPDYRQRIRLLMVGDGIKIPQVKEILIKYQVEDICLLTGFVPQEEGRNYLAACDILASPHVTNPDGSPFFGSPTKVFEYMAMGKGIVASDLDQIGEVLKHDRTAWLVQPGNVETLQVGLKTLIDDRELRERLGKAARHEAVAKYTWKKHTRKIIEKLRERFDENQ